MLSQIPGQVIHALLTRAPLSPEQAPDHVRLACVKHAASVRSEPGSNSPRNPVYTKQGLLKGCADHLKTRCSVVKEPFER